MATLGDLLATKGHEVIAVHPSDTVLQAANLMNDRNIGGVVVLDGDRLAGIFTERDVLRRVVAQGLDPTETDELQECIASIPSLGCTVLLVDHDMSLVFGVCDAVHVLDFGRVIASGPPAEVRLDAAVVAAYLGTGSSTT